MKPTLSLRKVHESEYVNPATYWSLKQTVVAGKTPNDVERRTYELRIIHDAVETQDAFFEWNDGDSTELVTDEERTVRLENISLHDAQLCDAHREAVAADAVFLATDNPCAACLKRTAEYANSVLDMQCRVMTLDELNLLQQLRTDWQLVVQLVHPAWNEFTNGWRWL